jgi:hypothetical protein
MKLCSTMILLFLLLVSACNTTDPGPLPTLVEVENPIETPTVVPFADVAIRGILEFWQAEKGTLPPNVADGWQFSAQFGDPIRIRIIGIAAILTLQTVDGYVLQRGTSIETTLPSGGIYTVVVQSLSADGGDYEIGLSYADRPNPNDTIPSPLPEVVGVPTPVIAYDQLGIYSGLLTAGETVSGTVAAGAEDHLYTFEGAFGSYAQLDLRRVFGNFNPRLTLYDPSGVPVAMDEDAGGDQIAMLQNIHLSDGIYTVRVAGNGYEGGYALRLIAHSVEIDVTPTPPGAMVQVTATPYDVPAIIPATLGNRLEDHVPVVGFADIPGYVATYPIYVTVGEVFTVGAGPVGDSAVRPLIVIYDPLGNIMTQTASSTSNADGDALAAQLRATIEGTYMVTIASEANETGQYVVGYGSGSTWRDVYAGEAVRDDPNEGQVERRGLRQVWSLQLSAGDIIMAAVNPESNTAFDPILELVPADAPLEYIAIDDNGGGDRSPFIRNVTIPRTGTYLLRIKPSQAMTSGEYTLVWRYINVAPTPTPIAATYPLLILDDYVADGEYRFYPFQARRGQHVRITVTSDTEGFDPVAALISSTGLTLIEVDDYGDSLYPSFTFDIPADGTYNVRINGYLSGGAFHLVVMELFY